MRLTLLLMVFWFPANSYGYQKTIVSGRVLDSHTLEPIKNAKVIVEGSSRDFDCDKEGQFEFPLELYQGHVLLIVAKGFVSKRIHITKTQESLSVGDIFLDKDITSDQEENLVALTDGELTSEEVFSISSGLLQSTKDIFLRRAAFDFGQVFFRVRGFDSRNSVVMLNGAPMNNLENGRPQWSSWGGLNDITRNQVFTNGLTFNPHTFGGILGNTNINVKPSRLRKGLRVSSSASNRTYRGRLMATYNSGVGDNTLSFSMSASRRWSEEGYIQGTLYDAFSLFGALEYQPNEKNSLMLAVIWANNRRGRSSAITEEVFDLRGSRYNPYWGFQNGNIRNSRQSQSSEPILLFTHGIESDKLNINSSIVYQFGNSSRSRLGFYNAANPDPTYYRYLPSFYLNGPLGADFINGDLAREGFLSNGQVQWENIYSANANVQNQGKAAYVLYDDVSEGNSITLASSLNYEIDERFTIGFGGYFKNELNQNFARIEDLMGAEFHEDIDVFSNTRNDVLGSTNKIEGDRFNYDYETYASQTNIFSQLKLNTNKLTGFLTGTYDMTSYGRTGSFQNERFLENSLGDSEKASFGTLSLKGGTTFFISGRHWISVQAGKLQRPPVLQNLFINPRESNEVVPDPMAEDVTQLDVSYFGRLPNVTFRFSGFYTRFMNITDVNFFFVDSGLGSDFVQEVITGMDRLHKGLEMGIEYQLSAGVKLSLVGNLGDYRYASDPSVQINFDTAGPEEDLIDPEGNIDLGISKLKGLRVPQGPQTALSLGVEYRDPKYWWLGATTNYLGNNYINVSSITRTQSFSIDPETGIPFADATQENLEQLLQQERLENVYLLNLVGGKSWLHKGKYISAFFSLNNLFDTTFRTGGYEQSRNGNYGQLKQDQLSGSPSFGPKYWYGFGRTYFLNLAINF